MPTSPSILAIPDSLIAKEATDLLREHSTDLLFNHSIRVYLFAAEEGHQRGVCFDRELLYVDRLEIFSRSIVAVVAIFSLPAQGQQNYLSDSSGFFRTGFVGAYH